MSAVDVQDIYPLTPLQEGILFHTLMAPDQGFYIDQLVVELAPGSGADPARVRQVFEALVRRHEVLRTGFIWEGQERPLQLVAATAPLPFQALDWSPLSGEALADARERLARTERAAGFDLARAPLLRVAAASLPAGGCQLVITYHHIILDAWSVANLFREFALMWTPGATLAPVAMRFRDHVITLGGRERPDAQAFWREHLAGLTAPTALDLAAAPRQGRPAAGVGMRDLILTAEQTERLKGAARSMAVTLAALLHAAWGRLLGLYAGTDDVVFGITLAGRPADRAGAAALVGLCINTLPLRLRMTPDATVEAWVRTVHQRLADVRAHEFTPLQKVRQWSGLDSGVPLFHSVMAFENAPGLEADPTADGTSLTRHGSYRFHTNYPVNVMVVPGPRLALRINFDESLYDGGAIERCLAHLASLLMRLATHPERPLRRVGLLDGPATAAMRSVWCGPDTPYDDNACIHHLFEARARQSPEAVAVAVLHGERTWTYGWLDRQANGLAHRLREHGAGPERRVAVLAVRSVELLVAVLAIHKCGAAYVPLDPMYPAPRIEKMLRVSQPSLLLCSPELADQQPAVDVPVLPLDGRQGEAPTPPPGGARPDNTAYVIFTSGSSGVPKGIDLAHRGLCNMLPDWNRLFGMGAGDRLLQFASISFDASVWEIYAALISGATLCIASRATLFSAQDLLGALRDLRVTHALLPPSLLGSMNPRDLPELRCIAAIGERCTNDIVRRWSEGRRFYNAYGPAEATITDCVYEVTPAAIPPGDPPIGRPMSRVRLYALDAAGEPLPAGVAGELAIGGVNVARGYIGQAAATAEKFVPDPFADEPGARMYRTGDQVVINAQGDFRFLGRADFQVKIRGVRVELGEVEDAVRQHPAVRDAVVLARPGQDGGSLRLVAYIVGQHLPAAPEFRAFMRERVAEAMVPASFVPLDTFPLNPNGKIDRGRLPEPPQGRAENVGAWRAPHTELEQRLAAVWAQVLRLDRVGLDDNYFDLGGDSVISIRLVAAAQRAGLQLSPRDLFEHQTIGALATALGQVCPPADDRVGAGGLAGSAPAHVGPVPALPMQRHFLDVMGPRIAHYNQAVLLRLRAGLTLESVTAALQALRDRHDALRLAARREAAGPWQLQVQPAGAPFILARVPSAEADAAMDTCQRSLDPAQGCVLGAVWIDEAGASPPSLLLAAHHLAVDAVSWSVLLDDLASACLGEPPGPPAASFVPVAQALHEAASHPAVLAHQATWRQRLAGSTAAGASLPAAADTDTTVQHLSAADTRALLDTLEGAAHAGDVLLAALAEVLGPGTFVDLESTGREMPELAIHEARAVGWFTAIAPFQLPRGGPLSAETVAAATQERLAWAPGAYTYALLRQAQATGSGPRTLCGEPPRRLLVNWLGRLSHLLRPEAPFRFAQSSSGAPRDAMLPRLHDMELNASLDGDQLVMAWQHPAHDSARHLIQQVTLALQAYAGRCRTVASDLPPAALAAVLAQVRGPASDPVAG